MGIIIIAVFVAGVFFAFKALTSSPGGKPDAGIIESKVSSNDNRFKSKLEEGASRARTSACRQQNQELSEISSLKIRTIDYGNIEGRKIREIEREEVGFDTDMLVAENQQTFIQSATVEGITPSMYQDRLTKTFDSNLRLTEKEELEQIEAEAYERELLTDLKIGFVYTLQGQERVLLMQNKLLILYEQVQAIKDSTDKQELKDRKIALLEENIGGLEDVIKKERKGLQEANHRKGLPTSNQNSERKGDFSKAIRPPTD